MLRPASWENSLLCGRNWQSAEDTLKSEAFIPGEPKSNFQEASGQIRFAPGKVGIKAARHGCYRQRSRREKHQGQRNRK